MTPKNQPSKKNASDLLIKIKEALSKFDEVRGFL